MPNFIRSFMILLAVILMIPRLALAQEPPACEFEYTVQAGDWLSKIAEKYYGDPQAYPVFIAAANTSVSDPYTNIDDPNLIEPGWKICIPAAESPAAGPQTAPAGLSQEELANATYQSEYTQNGTAPLTNGEYSEAAAPGSATMIKVTLTANIAYGSLNGQDAAAVILVTDPGGSGTFYDLAVVVSQNGQAVNVATTLLGDRLQIKALAVKDNQIVVELVQAGPNDPLCCPSQQVSKTYQLQGTQLNEVSSEAMASESSSELVGPLWQWQQTLLNNGDKLTPDDPAKYTLQFLPEGQVALQADCNRVSGGYQLEGSALTIAPGPTTLAACPPGSLGDAFVANVSAVTIYSFEAGQLLLDLKAGSGTMRFIAQSSELAGTAWDVISYNNGQQAVVSVIIGTGLTAVFGADGKLTGSAGCNTYSAPYQVEGDGLTIGPAMATRKACAEPAGIMEQEQQYLTALGSAATYAIRGDRLEVRNAAGSLVATFQAVN